MHVRHGCQYTFNDGLIEARNESDEPFEIARIRQALAEARGDSSREILDYMLECFNDFIGFAEIKDDCTLIIIRCR